MNRASYVEMLWGDPMVVASRALRSVITAAPGKTLYVGDYKSIEMVAAAWLAGDKAKMDAFAQGLDLYKIAASQIFKVPYDEVTKDQRQVGKVAELALGYQGGERAFATMAETYGLAPLPKEQVIGIKNAWREANSGVVQFWKQIQTAAIDAIQQPGTATTYRGIACKVWNGFLCVRLPSGRVLYYYHPEVITKIVTGENDDGTTYEWETVGIRFMGVDPMTRQWKHQETWGGRLFENIDQGFCRDLCAHGQLNAEAAGYPVILSVHDEILSETDENFGSVPEFERTICRLPAWAAGIPLQAEAWRGRRYRK